MEIEVEDAVTRKVEQSLKKIEIDKPNHFVLKNDKKQQSFICKVAVVQDGESYRVVSFAEDKESFPGLSMYLSGYISLSKERYASHKVIPALRYFLTILYTLGFEIMEVVDMISYATGKPFEYSKVHAKEIFKLKESIQYDAEYVMNTNGYTQRECCDEYSANSIF